MFKKIGAVLVSVAPLSAFAAVPAAVTTAISDAQTDAVTVATAVPVARVRAQQKPGRNGKPHFANVMPSSRPVN